MVVPALEPVFSSVGSYLVNGQVYSLPVYMSLLPIMAGVMICSATELSFTWLGFSCAMASNVLFAARAIFSKKLMGNMNPVNVYNYVSMIALLFCIPPVFIVSTHTIRNRASVFSCRDVFQSVRSYRVRCVVGTSNMVVVVLELECSVSRS
jgi:drug/metabolite transporter (DMT)-like permease